MNEKQKRICVGTLFAVVVALFGEWGQAVFSGEKFSFASAALLAGVILFFAFIGFLLAKDRQK